MATEPTISANLLLSEEEIAKRRVSYEDANIKKSKQGLWICPFCEKRFTSETRLYAHYCKARQRSDTLKTVDGQNALAFYREWMKKRRFGEPSAEAFMESRMFTSFNRFAEMVRKARITRPDKYIDLMLQADLQPPLWCGPTAYSVYTGWYDSLQSPLEQVQESIELLITLSESKGVKLGDILEELGSQGVLNLIQQRRLSPWFLFCSGKFSNMLRTLDTASLKSFNAVVNSAYWGKRFSESPKTIGEIKYIVQELNL